MYHLISNYFKKKGNFKTLDYKRYTGQIQVLIILAVKRIIDWQAA